MNSEIVTKAKELAESLPVPQTKEDWANNGDAADQLLAGVDFRNEPGDAVLAIHAALFMKVGHKRLGRIWARIGKSL